GEERLELSREPVVREEVLVEQVEPDPFDGPGRGRERVERRRLAPEAAADVQRFGPRKVARLFAFGSARNERERDENRGEDAGHTFPGVECHEAPAVITKGGGGLMRRRSA